MNARRTTPREATARVVAKAAGTTGAAGPIDRVESLLGSSIQPALIEIRGIEVQLGTIVAAAHKASGLSFEAWNALAEADREKLLVDEIERRRSPEPDSSGDHPSGPTGPALVPPAAGPKLLLPEIEEIDEEIALLVADLRERVAASKDEGVQFIHGMRVGLQRLDAAMGDLLLELGVAPLEVPAARSTLPAEVPEGKVRIRVRGPQAGRRRLGRQFTPEPQDLDVTDDELVVLRADSELTVREIGFQD